MRLPSSALFAVFVLVSVVIPQSFVRLAKAGELCPTNTIVCNGTHTSTAPALSIFCEVLETGDGGQASYDLRSGMFHSSTSTLDAGAFGTSVLAQDIYEVIGNPSGIPINFLAKLTITATRTLFASACALLSESIENQAVYCAGIGTFIVEISIPLEYMAGEPFQLLYQLSTSGVEGVASSISAVLEFEGLPPGATITSCQGFFQDAPVQIREESWGQIKAVYR